MKKISRRDFMKAAGVSAAALSLAACGGSSSTSTAASSAAESTSAAAEDPVTLKFDLTASLEHPWGQAATEFASKVNELSDGVITVEIYPSSTSGSEADSLAGMLVGTTDMTMSGGSFSYCPYGVLLEAPFAFNSEEDVEAFVTGDNGSVITQAFTDAGFKFCWYQLRGPRELTSKDPKNSVEDIKGVKMRMSGNALHTAMWNAAGAVTSSIALSETFNALSQGVVDMQENPYDLIYDNSFYEVQSYVNETNHVFSTIFNLIAVEKYNSLSENLRGCIDDACAYMQDWVNDYYFEHKDDYKQKCEEAGMTINTDVDRESFMTAMMPAIKEFLQGQEGDLWEMYVKM